MKGEDEGVLQEERKGEKREPHSPELDRIWHEMNMSFLEVERRAAVAHRLHVKTKWQYFGKSRDWELVAKFHSNEMLKRDFPACPAELLGSRSQYRFLEPTHF